MCGISLIAGKASVGLSDIDIRNVFECLKERGPDAEGISRHDNAVFLHTRLKIQDVDDRANQPMFYLGSAIIFNGEIYNFNDLRSYLIEQYDLVFHSTGDTEVLLKGFVHEGIHFLKKLRGAYAAAIYADHKVYLFRDSFGMKPLYYSIQDESLFAASSIAALKVTAPTLTKDWDAEQLFLKFGFIPEPKTQYNEIRSLEPGCLFEFDVMNKRPLKSTPFLTLDSLECFRTEHTEVPTQNITEELARIIKRHIISDVGCTLALSSGFDSTLIGLLTATELDSAVTLNFTGNNRDKEWVEAKEIAETLEMQHQVIAVSEEDVILRFDEYSKKIDSPTFDGFNVHVLTKAVTGLGGTVVVTGLGGDEILGSYPSFKVIPLLWTLRHILRPFITILKLLNIHKYSGNHRLLKLIQCDLTTLPRLYFWFRSITLIDIDSRVLTELERLLPNMEGWSIKKTICYLESSFYMRSQLLRDGDYFAMSNSVELRTPFVDIDMYNLILKNSSIINKKYLVSKIFPDSIADLIAVKLKKSFSTNVLKIVEKNAITIDDARVNYLRKIYERSA